MDHAGRRARLAGGFGAAGIDALYVSRLANVRYLSGFSGSNAHLLVTAADGCLLTDGRYTTQAEREAPDLRRVIYASDLPGALAGAARAIGAARFGFETDALSFQAHADLAAAGVELVGTRGLVEALRAFKDAEEIASIGSAQAATDAAFAMVVPTLAEGVTERGVALALEVAMRGAGADGLAFDTIVGFGPGAAEPHHRPEGRTLARGDLVKMDFGAVVAGYHSDMTRTVAFGEPSARAREVYEVVRGAQDAGVRAVRAGATGGEVDDAARSIIAQAGLGEWFPHGLGHGVGLEIHELPALRPANDRPLGVGQVVTVEPGVYLPGAFGVRIEDMVEVSPAGPVVMAATPKDLLVL
jgi:Xaa-Pro aminopeptidase